MGEELAFSATEQVVINPLYMFRWEEAQDAYVLLYPEGIVKLNETAGEILHHCSESESVGDLIEKMKNHYAASDPATAEKVEDGVYKFLEVSHAKGWIRRKT